MVLGGGVGGWCWGVVLGGGVGGWCWGVVGGQNSSALLCPTKCYFQLRLIRGPSAPLFIANPIHLPENSELSQCRAVIGCSLSHCPPKTRCYYGGGGGGGDVVVPKIQLVFSQ